MELSSSFKRFKALIDESSVCEKPIVDFKSEGEPQEVVESQKQLKEAYEQILKQGISLYYHYVFTEMFF